jgi:hypothetical protein
MIMKRIVFTTLISIIALQMGYSQSKTYSTFGWEMIFSFADIDNNGNTGGNIMRWAPVLNIQGMLNHNLNNNIGLFTGLAVRNVGYISNNYVDREGDDVRKKFRTYNLAIPVGIKVGNLKKLFLYAGYEFELPFHYKEKTFKDDKKTIEAAAFFSDRVEQFQHALIVGIQFKYGTGLKFKYYFSEFHNQDYAVSDGYKPYEGLQANVFYFSLNFGIFRNTKFYYTEENAASEYY